jgi:hypothetical protein
LVIDCATRARDVVDVDADDLDVGEGTLDHQREVVAQQIGEGWVVDPGARDDEAVRVLRPQQRGIVAALTVGRDRFDHDAIAVGAGGRREAAQGFGQDRVARDLLGRLAHDEGDDIGAPTGELAGRRVRVIVELLGRIHDAASRVIRDLHLGAPVQHEGHGRSRHPGQGGDILARGSSCHPARSSA